MRFEYRIYPEAITKLESAGIAQRVQDLKESENGLPFIGAHLMASDIRNAGTELKEKGFYDNLPPTFSNVYKTVMNGILRDPSKHVWFVERPEGMVTEKCELEDLCLFSGEIASMVLTPEEIWDHTTFGFDSPTGFITAVGAYIRQQSHNIIFKEGYKWTTNKSDGSQILNEITGSEHSDLRVHQTDVAPYQTTDPFGNETFVRPELSADQHTLSPYHSTEASMLVAVMKYVDQQNVDVKYRADDANSLIDWGFSLGQSGGSTTEHFGGFDQNPLHFFIGYDIPLPQLNEKNETDQSSPHIIGVNGDGHYGAYVAQNGDLVFSYQDEKSRAISKKPITARFLPEEADHLVKGLVFQAANGLGRTSSRQLLDILAYKHSPAFEVDQKRYNG